MSKKLIKISDIDNAILIQLPFSVYAAREYIDVDYLSYEHKYLLLSHLDTEREIYQDPIIYGAKVSISKYNDFEHITTLTEYVKYNFENYINSSVGGYPFDVTFGNNLKSYLQQKNTSLKNTLLSQEITKIINYIKSLYDVGIEIINIDTIPVEHATYTEYQLYVEIKIDEDIVKITI